MGGLFWSNMKNLIIIGNLKMNTPNIGVVNYLKKLNKIAKTSRAVLGVAVPSIYLSNTKKYGQNLLFGAQNVHQAEKGAFTGELSASMLSDFDTRICLVGHSERRTQYGETDEQINEKILRLLSYRITPVLCVGESLQDRKNKTFAKYVCNQLNNDLAGLSAEQVSEIIIAYEPIWAIGTGESATMEEIAETCGIIKGHMYKCFGVEAKVLYGGSVNSKNCTDIFNITNVDGVLVGGACLDINHFEQIIQSADLITVSNK